MFSTRRFKTTGCLNAVAVLMGLSGCAVDAVPARLEMASADRQVARKEARAKTPGGRVDLRTVEPQEVDLVESVVSHRSAYIDALHRLQQYYDAHGLVQKHEWTQFELTGLMRVKKFRYVLDAEVPREALRASESIPEADALYEEGLTLMRRGGHGVPGLFNRDRMVEAAELLRTLVERFPASDKIDDAAFLCGEIHKDYLSDQEEIAVRWYERAWTWDPNTPYPARFQAAVVYDYRLHDRDRALELYRQVVQVETAYESNVRFAARRIEELTADAGNGRTAGRY